MNEPLIRKARAAELPQIAALIVALNMHPEQHCLHSDEDLPSVTRAIEQLDGPAEDAFAVAISDGQVAGVLGCDSSSSMQRGWLWGPFVAIEPWDTIADRLLAQLMTQLDAGIRRLNSFTNHVNHRSITFYERNGFRLEGITHIYVATRPASPSITIQELCPELAADDNATFVALHDAIFPGTYASGRTILKKLSHDHRVYVARDGDALQGYIYAALSETTGEGFVHFVGVRPEARGKGIGRRLLATAMHWLFEERHVSEVGLTVSDDRGNARALYERAGFLLKYSGVGARKDW